MCAGRVVLMTSLANDPRSSDSEIHDWLPYTALNLNCLLLGKPRLERDINQPVQQIQDPEGHRKTDSSRPIDQRDAIHVSFIAAT